MLWQIDGTPLRILGSVHCLRSQDHPLPRLLGIAYRASGVVAFESDFLAPELQSFGRYTDSRSLRDDAPDVLDEVIATIRASGQDVRSAHFLKPWRAALAFVIALLATRGGFLPQLGVELTLRTRAPVDGKPIAFLEGPLDGLRYFDSAPIDVQVAFLRFAVREQAQAVHETQSMVSAWRTSNVRELELMLEVRLRQFPEIFEGAVIARNHRWLPPLLARAKLAQPALVVIGVLHCVGENGLPALLAKQGLSATLLPYDA